MNRKPVWAGPYKFYPSDPNQLHQYLEQVIDVDKTRITAKAVVLPHAGYVYSGLVAGKTISGINIPDTMIVLGPNHTGLGQPYSLIKSGKWITPLGPLTINETLAILLLDDCKIITEDFRAHEQEHSIEVILPFLQFLNKNTSIVPMVISDCDINNFELVGMKIAEVIKTYNQPVLIVASSDMTHFESQKKAEQKDSFVIDSILKLNPQEMMVRIKQQNVTMCGFAPVAMSLFAAINLGAKKSELIEYRTSAEASGDYSNVVGYAGIVIS
ncbi:MAG: AmmeMemoRadiSam system protein B [Candidatus Omnitrophota bacterium]